MEALGGAVHSVCRAWVLRVLLVLCERVKNTSLMPALPEAEANKSLGLKPAQSINSRATQEKNKKTCLENKRVKLVGRWMGIGSLRREISG